MQWLGREQGYQTALVDHEWILLYGRAGSERQVKPGHSAKR
jgi:hypothetical protein